MRSIRCFFLVLFFFQSMVYASAVAINPLNHSSVARGAQFFMAYCSGCHALKYTRYSPIENVPVEPSMPTKDAYQWFGQVPPDLSLIAKKRGPEWLYQYLTSFYPDVHQPYGENNTLMPNVMMPNPFPPQAGDSSVKSEMVTDIVTFLTYVSDPSVTVRYRIGPLVLVICFVLLMLIYCLKQLYWKKVCASQQR